MICELLVLQSSVLRDLSSMHRLVVATGGGAVIRPVNWYWNYPVLANISLVICYVITFSPLDEYNNTDLCRFSLLSGDI